MFFTPIKAAVISFKPEYKIEFLKDIFISLSFVPLLSHFGIIPLLSSIFLQHLLSNEPGEASINYHYTLALHPVRFIAFVLGVKKIVDLFPKFEFIGSVLLIIALIVNFDLGPHFRFYHDWDRQHLDHGVILKKKNDRGSPLKMRLICGNV